jgi:VanZ family protein
VTTPGRWRAAAAALAVAIVVLGIVPIGDMVEVVGPPNPITTTGHFVAYAALAFVLAVALSGWRPTRRTLVVTFLLAVALGAGVEVLQGPIPYRDASLLDLAVDAGGAAVGLAVFSAVARGRRSRSRPG